jgi:hypothetical protein
MSNDKIKNLLSKLHEEIGDTAVDDETRSLLRVLESDIDDLLDTETEPTDAASVLERAQQLETSFAATHPVAERFIREIMDVLGKMGV